MRMRGCSCSIPDLGCTRPTHLCLPALHPSVAGKEHYEEQQMLALGQAAILNLRTSGLLGPTVPQEEIKLPYFR